MGSRKEPKVSEEELTNLTMERSFISFIHWSKIWGKKSSLFKPDADFVTLGWGDELFQFSFILNMQYYKAGNYHINKGSFEVCKVGLKKNWM